jgi:non-homologous end joining protein Ku
VLTLPRCAAARAAGDDDDLYSAALEWLLDRKEEQEEAQEKEEQEEAQRAAQIDLLAKVHHASATEWGAQSRTRLHDTRAVFQGVCVDRSGSHSHR